MAEFAEESVEKLVPTFELIRAAGLIQSDHLAEFIKRCGRYEYRLQKRTKSVGDYNTYIRYLKDFLEYWQRQRALKKRFSKDRVRKNIQQKICWIYKIRSERFKKKEFYLEAARFNKSNGLVNSASEAYNRLLQIHGTHPEFYAEAANFEAEKNRSWENARTILQLALRKFPTDVLLWTTMLRTELAYVKYIRARREKLAAVETKTPKSEEAEEVEKPKDNPAMDSEADDAVLRMDVVRIVIEEAKTAIPSDKLDEFLENLKDLKNQFAFANDLLSVYNPDVKKAMSTFVDCQFRNVTIHLEVDNLLNRTEQAIAIACGPAFQLTSLLGNAVTQAGGQQFQNNVSALTANGPVPDPRALSVPASGTLRSQHMILVPLRRHFASRMYEVFCEVLNEAMRLEVTSLALPPIGTGGFHLDRTLCANALSDALQSINDFRRLNRISIIDTNRNMVGFFHERMSQLVTRDHHQNPQHYPTLHLQPFARSSQSQTQATGNGSSNLFVNAINVQPLPLSILPFSSYFTALSKQRIADLRAARLEEIEREKDQNKEQPSDIVEACPVCLMEMYEEDMTSYSENDDMTVVQLGKCSHCFHRSCVITWFRNQVKCPLCQTEMTATLGPQPSDGRMVSEICTRGRLDGYEDVYGFIKINYSFPNGIQTDQHLRPGVPYTGTHRECYLPNTYEGDVVLRLLQVAFNRGHIFTVGDSITSGQRNTVVWNGIHHKTSRHGGPAAYGYPDPGYLNRVKNELAAVGVTQDDIDTDDSMDDSYTDEDD